MSTPAIVPASTKQILKAWYAEQMIDATPVLHGSFLGWLFGRFNQHAVTINGTVHLTSKADALDSPEGVVLLGHEYYHVVQRGEMGWWSFLARYLWGWRPSHVRDGRKHPLEAPAYARGDEVRRAIQ